MRSFGFSQYIAMEAFAGWPSGGTIELDDSGTLGLATITELIGRLHLILLFRCLGSFGPRAGGQE